MFREPPTRAWSAVELCAVLVAGDVSGDARVGVDLVELCNGRLQVAVEELDLSLGLCGSGLEVVDVRRDRLRPVGERLCGLLERGGPLSGLRRRAPPELGCR